MWIWKAKLNTGIWSKTWMATQISSVLKSHTGWNWVTLTTPKTRKLIYSSLKTSSEHPIITLRRNVWMIHRKIAIIPILESCWSNRMIEVKSLKPLLLFRRVLRRYSKNSMTRRKRISRTNVLHILQWTFTMIKFSKEIFLILSIRNRIWILLSILIRVSWNSRQSSRKNYRGIIWISKNQRRLLIKNPNPRTNPKSRKSN